MIVYIQCNDTSNKGGRRVEECAYYVNKFHQNVGLETWIWRQIVTSERPHTRNKRAPYFLRTPLTINVLSVVFCVSVINCKNQESVRLKFNQFARFNKIMNSGGNRIVRGQLVRPARHCRVYFWPAARERLPTPGLRPTWTQRLTSIIH